MLDLRGSEHNAQGVNRQIHVSAGSSEAKRAGIVLFVERDVAARRDSCGLGRRARPGLQGPWLGNKSLG